MQRNIDPRQPSQDGPQIAPVRRTVPRRQPTPVIAAPATPPPPPPIPIDLRIGDAGDNAVFQFADLVSRCRADLAAPNRIDPYWSGQFAHHASKEFLSRVSADRQKAYGVLAPPDELLQPPAQARRSILAAARDRTPYTLNTYVASLGAVNGWRTCTSEQLAALTGDPRLAKPLSHPIVQLFAAGLVDLSVPHAWASGLASSLTLLRSGDRKAFDLLAPDLTYAEWLGASGGQPVSRRGYHDRHDILATELALRLAEYADVAAVFGEPFSTHDLLFGAGAGRSVDTHPGGADLTVVRHDGLRIAIEVTSTTSPYFEDKVERVVRRLALSPLEHTGVVFVFVVAPSVGASDSYHTTVLRDTNRAISKACRKHPGLIMDPTRARIAVALWQDWFPSSHTASLSFLSLRAKRIASHGGLAREDRWEDVDLLVSSSLDFKAFDAEGIQAFRGNAGLLGQTPYWLRDKLLDDLGTDEAAGRQAKRGAASQVRVPSRLLGLGTSAAMARHEPNVRALGYAGATAHHGDVRRTSAADARRMRSVALLDITREERTVIDVLKDAMTDPRHPYRDIELMQLLVAQPRYGINSAERLLDRLAAFLGQDRPDVAETVGWLVDERSARRRLLAWRDAGRYKVVPPGFPWR